MGFENLDYEIKFISYILDEEWKHYLWHCRIGKEIFTYKTGIGRATAKRKSYHEWRSRPKDVKTISCESSDAWVHVPKIENILHCLFHDAQCGNESFSEFCANFGYSNDSIKAFNTYRECEETANKLRKALGEKHNEIKEKIVALEL